MATQLASAVIPSNLASSRKYYVQQPMVLGLAAFVLLVSLCVIAGWVFRISWLKGTGFGTFIAPNTALLFFLSSVSIFLQIDRRMLLWSRLVGGSVALFSALIFSQYVMGVDLYVDRLFLGPYLNDWYVSTPPGRIAAPTALSFVFLGVSLVVMRTSWAWIVDLTSGGQLCIGYLAIVGYLYQVHKMYGNVMALPTPFLIITSAVTAIAGSEQSSLRSMMVSKAAGGVMFRSLAPVFLVGLPVLGWMKLRLLLSGVWAPEVAVAIHVVVAVVLFMLVVLYLAKALNGVDLARRNAQEALIRSEKISAAGRLASTIAHEINNPLEAAINAVYLAQTRPAESEKFIGIAERQLMRVSAISRKSLSFGRTGGKPVRLELRQVIEEVCALLQSGAEAKQVTISVVCDPSAVVYIDAGDLRQILVNLVSNAIDASRGEGQVSVAAYAGRSESVIEVTDNGGGIPREIHSHIFEPFFTTKPETGTGLGLYIVRELVTKNAGKIAFDSTDSGTHFWVTLPTSCPS